MEKGTEVVVSGPDSRSVSTQPRPQTTTSVPFFIVALLALAVGVFLRCWQLGDQVLLDDEWHAIHKLLRADAADIASHLGLADYSIPLTLYYRFLYLHGGLTEWGMRLPMLLAGIALIPLAPWLLRRQATAATLGAWSLLLAISPFMIYHSRTARPYALTTLLVFVAVMAFWKSWQREGSRGGWAAVYVVSAFLAGWLHLITLPFTLLPFIFFGIVALRVRDWRGIGRLLVLGIALALPLALALLPALRNDWGALAGKSGSDSLTLDALYRAFLLGVGTANPIAFVVLAVLGMIGAVICWRRDAGFVAYVATIVLGAGAAIALAHPAWIQHPGTYARYLQPAIPFLLLFVAQGFAALIARLAEPLQALGALAAAAALVAAGPLPEESYNPNQFMGHPYFQFDYDAAHNLYRTQLPDGPIPEFYRRLAAQPARSLVLIEAPWSLETNHDPQPLYQRVHRQWVRIGLTSPLCGARDYGDYAPADTGMRLSHFVHLDALLQGDTADADFLVMHLHPWPPTLPPAPQWPDVATCVPQLEQRLGAPAYRDEEVEVFALSAAGRRALVGQETLR